MTVIPQEETLPESEEEPPPPILAVAVNSTPSRVPTWATLLTSGQTRARAYPGAFGFCDKCGELGHMAKGCSGTENPEQVFQKLKALWGSENLRGMGERESVSSRVLPDPSPSPEHNTRCVDRPQGRGRSLSR